MSRFKPGDRVRCNWQDTGLKHGNVYTVAESMGDGLLKLKGKLNRTYHEERFEPVKPEAPRTLTVAERIAEIIRPRVGDWVESCITGMTCIVAEVNAVGGMRIEGWGHEWYPPTDFRLSEAIANSRKLDAILELLLRGAECLK